MSHLAELQQILAGAPIFQPKPGDYFEEDEAGLVHLCRASGMVVMSMSRTAWDEFVRRSEVQYDPSKGGMIFGVLAEPPTRTIAFSFADWRKMLPDQGPNLPPGFLEYQAKLRMLAFFLDALEILLTLRSRDAGSASPVPTRASAPTPMPPRVADIEQHWGEPPPVRSPRCAAWVTRIRAGWRPNRRISGMGYYDSAEYYGVYIWEYLNVLSPLLDGLPIPDDVGIVDAEGKLVITARRPTATEAFMSGKDLEQLPQFIALTAEEDRRHATIEMLRGPHHGAPASIAHQRTAALTIQLHRHLRVTAAGVPFWLYTTEQPSPPPAMAVREVGPEQPETWRAMADRSWKAWEVVRAECPDPGSREHCPHNGAHPQRMHLLVDGKVVCAYADVKSWKPTCRGFPCAPYTEAYARALELGRALEEP